MELEVLEEGSEAADLLSCTYVVLTVALDPSEVALDGKEDD